MDLLSKMRARRHRIGKTATATLRPMCSRSIQVTDNHSLPNISEHVSAHIALPRRLANCVIPAGHDNIAKSASCMLWQCNASERLNIHSFGDQGPTQRLVSRLRSASSPTRTIVAKRWLRSHVLGATHRTAIHSSASNWCRRGRFGLHRD